MQDLEFELPRIRIPRTWVNKGKMKGRVCDGSGPREARLAWAGRSLCQARRSRLTVRRGGSLIGNLLRSESSAEDDPGTEGR